MIPSRTRSLVFCTLGASIALSATVARSARADDVTAEERAFLESHQRQVVKIDPTKLTDPALPPVFAASFYTLTISLFEYSGVSKQQITVARVGNDLVTVGDPGTDDAAPGVTRLLSPALRLRTDQDAIVLQRALDVAYPIATDQERKAATFHHVGNQWKFVRNHFFGAESGYVFTTGPNGAITSVKFLLKMP